MKNTFRSDVAKRIEEKLIVEKHKRRYASTFSTIMGYVVAVAQAWRNHNWEGFDFTSIDSWIAAAPTLFLSLVIAVGGHATSINYFMRSKKPGSLPKYKNPPPPPPAPID